MQHVRQSGEQKMFPALQSICSGLTLE
jgi:hypothetical protein